MQHASVAAHAEVAAVLRQQLLRLALVAAIAAAVELHLVQHHCAVLARR